MHYSAVVNIRMCKHILWDLEHGFIHKAKEACHIKIADQLFIFHSSRYFKTVTDGLFSCELFTKHRYTISTKAIKRMFYPF